MTANHNGNEPTGTDDYFDSASEVVALEEQSASDIDGHLTAVRTFDADEAYGPDHHAAVDTYVRLLRDYFDDADRGLGAATELADALPVAGVNAVATTHLRAPIAAVLLAAHTAMLDRLAPDSDSDDAPGAAYEFHAGLALAVELALVEQAPLTVELLGDDGAVELARATEPFIDTDSDSVTVDTTDAFDSTDTDDRVGKFFESVQSMFDNLADERDDDHDDDDSVGGMFA